MREHLRKIGGQSVVYALPDVLNSAVGILLLPIYTAYLSTSEYGILGLMITVRIILSSVYRCGLDHALLKQHFDFKTEVERKQYYGSIVCFTLSSNLVITLIISAVGIIFFNIPDAQVPFSPYFLTVIWAVFFSGLDYIVMVRFRVRQKAGTYALLSLIHFVILSAMSILFITRYRQGAMGVLNSMLITSIIFFITSFIILRDLDFRPNYRYVWKALRFGMPLLPYLLATWLMTSIDRWLIKYYCDLSETGLYNLGWKIASFMRLAITAVSLAMVPYFYSLARQNKHNELAQISDFFGIFMLVMTLCVAGFGGTIVRILTESSYHEAASIIPILAAGFLFRGLYVLPGCSIHYSEKTYLMSVVVIFSAVTNLVLNIYLIPLFGMYGAAYATAISLFILCVVIFYLGQKAYRVQYNFSIFIKAFLVASLFYVGQSLIPELSLAWLTVAVRIIFVLSGVLILLYMAYTKIPVMVTEDVSDRYSSGLANEYEDGDGVE